MNTTNQHNAPSLHRSSFPKVEWRLTTSWPPNLDVLHSTVVNIAERVAAATDNNFQISIFAAGEIVHGLDVFDAVREGTVECGHTGSNYYTDRNEAFGIITGLPFGFTSQQQNAWLYYGGGLAATNEVYADFGIVSFPAGITGTQMGGWFKHEVNTINDLKGFRFRIPGLGGQVLQRLGVETVILSGEDVLGALQRDEIDAAEWIGPYDDEKLGLNQATDLYYYPGWWEPGTTLNIIINKQAWDTLPTHYQNIIETASYEAQISMLSRYETLNQSALARLVAGGTKLRPFSDQIMLASKETAFELYEDAANANPMFRDMFEDWKEFRKHIYGWNRINELEFTKFVNEE